MPDVLTILSSLAASGLLTAALLWLTKNWISERLKNAIKHEYDEKLETHKAQLKSQSDISIERLKSQLQVTAAERNFRYSKIFERTAETVAETYKRLLVFHDAVASYTSPMEWQGEPTKAEKRKTAGDRYKEFLDYYRPNCLFLPKETERRIDEFYPKLHSMAVEFMWGIEDGRGRIERKTNPDEDPWIKAMDFMNKEVPPLLNLLKDDLRGILGTLQEEQEVKAKGTGQ
jgi:hypothetical protein